MGTNQDSGGGSIASRSWQLIVLLVPILLTTWLSFRTSAMQAVANQQLEKQNQLFSQQLQLSEELYKRRFDAYEKVYTKLVEIDEKLQVRGDAQQAEWNRVNADGITQLNQLLDVNKLHMSDKVKTLAESAWQVGANGDAEQLSQTIAQLETRMKSELDLWMLQKEEEERTAANVSKQKKQRVAGRSVQ
ncbi:MAG TPA: hypothetical protein VEG30_18015 [Terriglobales bacterium]|nr:hypothetical protein [Terriglobales bacterium]